jgi:hypothetical protein
MSGKIGNLVLGERHGGHRVLGQYDKGHDGTGCLPLLLALSHTAEMKGLLLALSGH